MTAKADFDAEEWSKITRGPALAGLIVISAQRGGTVRESLAMAKVYGETQKEHTADEFIGALARSSPDVGAHQFSSKEDLHVQGLAKITEATALVEAKATREELEAYRTLAMTIAQHAAEADKSGGFLGIGGERVTDKESAVLDEVAAALGTTRPPANPAS
jgi:hypothetical protein